MRTLSYVAGSGQKVLEEAQGDFDRYSGPENQASNQAMNEGLAIFGLAAPDTVVLIDPLILDHLPEERFEPWQLEQALSVLVQAIRGQHWPKSVNRRAEMQLLGLSIEQLARAARRDLHRGVKSKLKSLEEILSRLQGFLDLQSIPSNYLGLKNALESAQDCLKDARSWDTLSAFVPHIVQITVSGMPEDLNCFKSALVECVNEVRTSQAGLITDPSEADICLALGEMGGFEKSAALCKLPVPDMPETGDIAYLVRGLDSLSQLLGYFPDDRYVGTIQEICGLIPEFPETLLEFRDSEVAEKISALLVALHNSLKRESGATPSPWNVPIEELVSGLSQELTLIGKFDENQPRFSIMVVHIPISGRREQVEALIEPLCEKLHALVREQVAEAALKYDWCVDSSDPNRLLYYRPTTAELHEAAVGELNAAAPSGNKNPQGSSDIHAATSLV